MQPGVGIAPLQRMRLVHRALVGALTLQSRRIIGAGLTHVALILKNPPVESVPLQTDAYGAIRVGSTRVTLDTVIRAYRRGASAEDIARQFDALRIDDVYAVLAYYLRHREEVDAYLQEREVAAAEMRAELEHRFPPDGLRERLHARSTPPEA